HFQRFLSNKYQHPQPFYFFLWVLPLMTLPWLAVFIAGIWRALKRHQVDNAFRRLSVFALAWVAVPLIFFSFSGSKLPGYILPAVPGAIILAAVFAYQLIGRNRR